MRALTHLFLGFSFSGELQPRSLPLQASLLENLPFISKPASFEKEKKQAVQNLLDFAAEIGQVGSIASEADQVKIQELADACVPYSDGKPARVPLTGTHKLVYSASKGPSSGRLFGLTGKVVQTFVNEVKSYNQVSFGDFIDISLELEREVKSDSVIKVSFIETSFKILGKVVRQSPTNGGGAWKVKFVGKIEDEATGNQSLVRIMDTPSLFVLQSPLN